MNTEKYNGWTNRETWLVNLHFGDDTDYINEMVEQVSGDVDEMAEAIESYVLDYVDEHLGDNVFIRDMMNTSGIDWRELAEMWIESSDYEPEDDDEE